MPQEFGPPVDPVTEEVEEMLWSSIASGKPVTDKRIDRLVSNVRDYECGWGDLREVLMKVAAEIGYENIRSLTARIARRARMRGLPRGSINPIPDDFNNDPTEVVREKARENRIKFWQQKGVDMEGLSESEKLRLSDLMFDVR